MRLRDPDKTNEVGLGHSGGTVHSSSEQVFIVLSPSSSVNIPQTCHCLTTSSKLLASKSNRTESKGFECLGGTSEQWIFVVREKKGEGEILLRVEYWWERDWAGALAMEKWCHWWGYCRQLEMTAGTWCQLCLLAQTVSCCSPLTPHKPSELESTKSKVPFVAPTFANGWERDREREAV